MLIIFMFIIWVVGFRLPYFEIGIKVIIYLFINSLIFINSIIPNITFILLNNELINLTLLILLVYISLLCVLFSINGLIWIT